MGINIFELAAQQLKREGADISNNMLLLDRAIEIRKFLDKHGMKKAQRIIEGQTVYKYGNRIRTYAKAV